MSTSKPIIRVKQTSSLADLLEIFVSADDDVVLVDENSVITAPHLELLTDFPRSASAALVGKQTDFSDTLVRATQVVSASSASHKPTETNRVFTGAIRLSKKQAPEITRALEQAASRGAQGNALDLLLVALIRATIKVDAAELVDAPFARTTDASIREAVAKDIAKIKIPRLRLKLANRANDGFFSVFVLRRFSKLLTWAAVKIGATPNQVTLASFAIGLYAAYLFALGDTWSLIGGAILLQVSIIVDCVDGELARYTRKFSELGAWLDAITDRVKEYAVFLGLAYGAFVQHGQNLWLLAAVLMAIQTFRHLSDYNFSQVVKARAVETEPVPVDFMSEWDGITAQLEQVDSEADEPSLAKKRIRYWLGKIIIFPIGERWLAISFTAAVGGAMFTFTLLPLLALFSMIWVYRVRLYKTIDMAKTRIASPVISLQLDLGFPVKTFFKRLDWLEPSLLRALELGVLIVLFAITGNLGVSSFVILFSIAFNHYDNLYRAMQGEQKPEWLSILGYTVFGRIALIGAALYLGVNLDLFAGYFFVWFLIVSSIQWVVSRRVKTKT
ncbi:CDP-alcohol phosphatidyltransferase [Microbacteriaceae bacterium]